MSDDAEGQQHNFCESLQLSPEKDPRETLKESSGWFVENKGARKVL